MASVNKVIIVGNLGRDPENRYLPSGEQVTSIAVATTENWTDKKSGEKKSLTEWHRISFFCKLAEIADQKQTGRHPVQTAQPYLDDCISF